MTSVDPCMPTCKDDRPGDPCMQRSRHCPSTSNSRNCGVDDLSHCCRAPFRREKLTPAAKLEKVRIPLRPTEAVLAPLPGARDVLPNGRTIHTLTLTYKLSVAEAGKHCVTLPLLNRQAQSAPLVSTNTSVPSISRKLVNNTRLANPEPATTGHTCRASAARCAGPSRIIP